MIKLILYILLISTTLLSDELDWPNDYEAALIEAKKDNKNIYMLITSESCRWCRKFESTTLEEDDILEKLESKYVLLHISRDRDYLPEKYKKKRVPRHYFITPKEDVIFTFLGYWNTIDFSSFLDDVDIEYKKSLK